MSVPPLRLGVNVDHVATLRNARAGRNPDPVRAALLQLEKEGLISFGDNRRPVVTSLTISEIVELFEIRVALETLAVERAVANMDDGTFRLLESKLEAMQRSAYVLKQFDALRAAAPNFRRWGRRWSRWASSCW